MIKIMGKLMYKLKFEKKKNSTDYKDYSNCCC